MSKIVRIIIMKSRIKVVLSCVSMLAITVVLLLVFFLTNKNNKNQFYCSASDIEICVGDWVSNFYHVSKPNAQISFSVDKENIIEIDENKIYGLSAGEVEVTLTAILGEEKSVDTFIVKVYNQNYSIEFSAIADCDFEGNTLFAHSNTCQFTISVYDALNQKLSNPKFEMVVNGNATVQKNFYNIMLMPYENCILTFVFSDIGYEATLSIVMSI